MQQNKKRVNFSKNKIAQSSIEYLMVAGTLLIIIGISFVFVNSSLNQSIQDSKSTNAVNTLAKAIDQVYALGPGTKINVTIDLPNNIESQIVEDNLIGLIVNVNGSLVHYYADTKANLAGSIPITKGTHTIILTVNQNNEIVVGSDAGILLTPSTISDSTYNNVNFSKKYLFTLTNNNSTTISNIVLEKNGTIAQFVTLPVISSTLSASNNFDFNIDIDIPNGTPGGVYTGNLTITSSGGNDSSSLLINVLVPGVGDTTPPVVTLSSPLNGTITNDPNVNFTFVVDDLNTIASCDLLIDNIVVGGIINPSKGIDQIINYTLVDSSEKIWDINCVDAANNFSISNNGPFTIRYQVVTPPINYLFEKRIGQSSDDAEERISNNRMTLNSNDLRLTRVNNPHNNEVGLRFLDFNMPINATINNSYMEFIFSTTTVRNPINLVIYGELSTNSQTFTTTPGNISNRIKTTESVVWNNLTSPIVGNTLITPDLTPIIQEIIGQPGWVQGNPITFIIIGDGRRDVYSFDGSQAQAPMLVIDYNI